MTHVDLPASPVPFASLAAATVRCTVVALQCAATIVVDWAVYGWAGWHQSATTSLAGAALMPGYLVPVGWAFLVSLKSLGTTTLNDPMWDRMPTSCEQRIGIIGLITCWLRKCVFVAWMSNVLQPFRTRATFDVSADTGGRAPVLMIHGYGCSHAVRPPTQQHLAAAGHPTDTIDFMPLLDNINGYAQDITVAVTQLTRAYGRASVLLCHGMGGLAARALLRQAKSSPVIHVITLGTPHRGTVMARTEYGHNIRRMMQVNPWLRQPAASEALAVRACITSAFSWHDFTVGLFGASWLGGARYIPFVGTGHISLLCDTRVRDAMLAELVQIEGVTATASV